jgi:hypothetical protein
VLPALVLVSRFQFAPRYRGFGHFLNASSSSRLEAMVGGALTRASAFRVGLGVSGDTIVSGSCVCPSHLWISQYHQGFGFSCRFGCPWVSHRSCIMQTQEDQRDPRRRVRIRVKGNRSEIRPLRPAGKTERYFVAVVMDLFPQTFSRK